MLKMLRAFVALVAAFAMTVLPVVPAMAAAYYVDNALGELAPDHKAKVAEPKPVQLLFQFTTNGKANARAVKYLKPQILALVQGSGLFSQVSETPVPGGAVLMITIDNIPEPGAAGKGFGAGLTFGLAGKIVYDDYVFTAEYVAGADAQPIKVQVPHRLYTQIGKHSPPPNATRVKNIPVAVETITRQGVSHAINWVALDPSFGGVAAVKPGPPPPLPAPGAPPTPAAPPAPAQQ